MNGINCEVPHCGTFTKRTKLTTSEFGIEPPDSISHGVIIIVVVIIMIIILYLFLLYSEQLDNKFITVSVAKDGTKKLKK